jgi:hypothetical protein
VWAGGEKEYRRRESGSTGVMQKKTVCKTPSALNAVGNLRAMQRTGNEQRQHVAVAFLDAS